MQTNSRKLQSNVLQLKMLKIPIIMHPYTTNQKNIHQICIF